MTLKIGNTCWIQ